MTVELSVEDIIVLIKHVKVSLCCEYMNKHGISIENMDQIDDVDMRKDILRQPGFKVIKTLLAKLAVTI